MIIAIRPVLWLSWRGPSGRLWIASLISRSVGGRWVECGAVWWCCGVVWWCCGVVWWCCGVVWWCCGVCDVIRHRWHDVVWCGMNEEASLNWSTGGTAVVHSVALLTSSHTTPLSSPPPLPSYPSPPPRLWCHTSGVWDPGPCAEGGVCNGPRWVGCVLWANWLEDHPPLGREDSGRGTEWGCEAGLHDLAYTSMTGAFMWAHKCCVCVCACELLSPHVSSLFFLPPSPSSITPPPVCSEDRSAGSGPWSSPNSWICSRNSLHHTGVGGWGGGLCVCVHRSEYDLLTWLL